MSYPEEFWRKTFGLGFVWRSSAAWLVPALVAGVVVECAYLVTHPYPAFGAGLYLRMAEQISQGGYQLPTTITGYARPIPFAYPPLMYYVVAAIRDLTGAGPIEISRLLPGVVSVAYLVPFYLFVRELFGAERPAGLAAFILAVSPPVLQWHISAGGIVRAPAALFLIAGLYTGLKLFTTHRRVWLAASVVLFGLTILTHPVYTVFFGLSYLWLFGCFDRTRRGLLEGTAVAGGALILSAPWWRRVLATHGVDVFLGAANTHGGIGKGLPAVVSSLAPDVVRGLAPKLLSDLQPAEILDLRPWMIDLFSVGTLLLLIWFALFMGASASLAVTTDFRSSRRKTFVTGWLALTLLVLPQPRFLFLVGAVVLTAVFYEYLHPLATWLNRTDRIDITVGPRQLELAILCVVVVAGLTAGTLYASEQLDSNAGSSSLPQFIDEDDEAAMAWAAANTPESAEFAVMGDAAEWFPLLSERRITTGPWGVEWAGGEEYHNSLRRYTIMSTCRGADCIRDHLADGSTSPDYLYIPKGEYTVRGMETRVPSETVRSLAGTPGLQVVYENDDVVIFSVNERLLRAADGDATPYRRLGTATPEFSARPRSSGTTGTSAFSFDEAAP